MKHKGVETIVCPLPTLLFWRMTDGVYYEIYSHTNFGAYYGSAFEAYVGSVIAKSQHDHRFTVYPEEKYTIGKHEKRTVDWIIDDESATAFIECKTKRLRLAAKAELSSEEELDKELEIAAGFVAQVYRTIHDSGFFKGQ